MAGISTQSALDKVRDILTRTYTGANGSQIINEVSLDANGHLVLNGYNPDSTVLHSRIGSTPEEYLAALTRAV